MQPFLGIFEFLHLSDFESIPLQSAPLEKSTPIPISMEKIDNNRYNVLYREKFLVKKESFSSS